MMVKGKTTTVLPAKLTAPKLGKVVSRTRLFRKLDEACNRAFIWVGAPAGFGKTTLVASYLVEHKTRPLWYQFDVRDADPATFFFYLRQAVGKMAPRKHETLPLLTPEYALGLPAFALNFFEQLFTRLRRPAVLVFDNFQELPENSPIQDLWQSLAAAMPEGVTIVFISRTAPPNNFASLLAAQQLEIIDAETMRLDNDEARLIGESVASNVLLEEQIASLNVRAGGWVAGLVLLLQGGGISVEQNSEIDSNLFDYFAAEVMRRTDEETQSFLMKCALFPVMDVVSTETLTGNIHAEVILRGLVRRNYFISRHPGEVMRYEFHPLFRDYLLEELRRRESGEVVCALKNEAGHILVKNEEYASAVTLLSESGDVKALVKLVLSNAETLVAEGRLQTLAQWLQKIPAGLYQQYPWLNYWLGASYMSTDLVAARIQFEKAYSDFAGSGDVMGMCVSWVGVVDTILNQLDNFHELGQWIDGLDKLIAEYGQPDTSLLVHLAPRMYCALVIYRPEHPHLVQWKKAAYKAFDDEQNISRKLLSGFYLSVAAVWTDDFSVAMTMLLKLRSLGEANAALPAARIVRELFESWFNWLSGEATLALSAAEAGIAIGQQSGVRLWEPLLIVEAMVSALTANDLVRAAEFSEQLKSLLPFLRRWDKIGYYHESGWLAALKGDYAEALRLQSEALQLVLEMGRGPVEAEIRIGMAQACFLNARFEERDDMLREARFVAEQTKSPLMTFSYAFVAAAYALDDGNLKAAEVLTNEAMRIGSQQGYRNFTWWLPQQASKLCAFALEKSIEPEYVRELIRTRRLVPNDQHNSRAWPWPVRIYVLGSFSLFIDEQPTAASGRVPGRAFDLLKVMITLGCHDVAESQIVDLLWPDAEGDMARQNLKTTLHRLRKLIGKDAVIVSDAKLSLNDSLVWVDIWDFENLLNRLEKEVSGAAISLLVDEVCGIYRGGYLPQETAFWMLSVQERIRNRFLRILELAAKRLGEQQHWSAAIDCYHNALEVDPLSERFYLGLIRCYHALGQMADGLAVYRRCREILADELQITPSAETERWHDRLRRSH